MLDFSIRSRYGRQAGQDISHHFIVDQCLIRHRFDEHFSQIVALYSFQECFNPLTLQIFVPDRLFFPVFKIASRFSQ